MCIEIESSLQMDSSECSIINFDTDLLRSVNEGEFERIKDIIEESSLYHKTDRSGSKLIHYSVRGNNQNLTEYLINKGCHVDTPNAMGFTPLMMAVSDNDATIVKMLLEAGGDIFKLNDEKQSSLHMMQELENGHRHTMQLLHEELQKQCSTSEEIAEKLIGIDLPLYLAALLKNAEIIECMLKRGRPVDEAHPIEKHTGLHVAVRFDDSRSVSVFLKYGANVNALDIHNANSLFNLYRYYPESNCEKYKILRNLVYNRVSTTSCLSTGLFNARNILKKSDREVLRILLRSGLDFSAKDMYKGKTILHYLVGNANPGVVDELNLYVHKRNINITNNVGNTALADAVAKLNVPMVEFLLKKGSKTDTRHSTNGASPLFYAYGYLTRGFRSHYRKCGELLLQYNADPQLVFQDGDKTRTIFDASLEKADFKRIKPVIAHLAILEQRGTPIIDIIWAKLNSHEPLKKYFYKCKRLLTKQISGRITLFHLLTSDKKRMARYLNDGKIVEIMRHTSYRNKMLHYQYYYDIFNKRYLEGFTYKRMKERAARSICECFQNRIDDRHVVVDKIIDYLNENSMFNIGLLNIDMPL